MPAFSPLDEALMLEALAEARLAADQGEVPAGAVVADAGGRIIGRGRNLVISLCDPTAHAEMAALKAAARALGNYRLAGAALYSTLEPCPMCLAAAIHARVGRLVFGAAEPKWGAAGSLLNLAAAGFNHDIAVAGGLKAEECAALISSFFREKRAVAKGVKL